MERISSKSFLIDASSLRALVRYFFLFDRADVLKEFIRRCFEQDTIILHEQVWREVKYLRGRAQPLGFITEGKAVGTEINPARLAKRGQGPWMNAAKHKKMSQEEREIAYQNFTKEADYHLIAFCLQNRRTNPGQEFIIVTEETSHPNDNKDFKKIPAICKIEGIRCINLVEMLRDELAVEIKFAFQPKRAGAKD